VPDMDSRKSHKTADSVNGVEARIGQESANSGRSGGLNARAEADVGRSR
jgi:hypothetical protein